MSVYKRGGVYWYKFLFQGQSIRESAKTNSKTVAREAERARRRDLELGFNRIGKRQRVPLFALATRECLASKTSLTILGRVYYEQYAREFGERSVSDITLNDIAALQRKHLGEGLSARTVNCEIATLRQILKHFGYWAQLGGRVRFLRDADRSSYVFPLHRTGMAGASRKTLLWGIGLQPSYGSMELQSRIRNSAAEMWDCLSVLRCTPYFYYPARGKPHYLDGDYFAN